MIWAFHIGLCLFHLFQHCGPRMTRNTHSLHKAKNSLETIFLPSIHPRYSNTCENCQIHYSRLLWAPSSRSELFSLFKRSSFVCWFIVGLGEILKENYGSLDVYSINGSPLGPYLYFFLHDMNRLSSSLSQKLMGDQISAIDSSYIFQVSVKSSDLKSPIMDFCGLRF